MGCWPQTRPPPNGAQALRCRPRAVARCAWAYSGATHLGMAWSARFRCRGSQHPFEGTRRFAPKKEALESKKTRLNSDTLLYVSAERRFAPTTVRISRNTVRNGLEQVSELIGIRIVLHLTKQPTCIRQNTCWKYEHHNRHDPTLHLQVLDFGCLGRPALVERDTLAAHNVTATNSRNGARAHVSVLTF